MANLYITSHVMAIVTCTISVIVCEIITYELLKYRRLESLTFEENAMVMRYDVAGDMTGKRIEFRTTWW